MKELQSAQRTAGSSGDHARNTPAASDTSIAAPSPAAVTLSNAECGTRNAELTHLPNVLLHSMALGHLEQANRLRAIGEYGMAEVELQHARRIQKEADAL